MESLTIEGLATEAVVGWEPIQAWSTKDQADEPTKAIQATAILVEFAKQSTTG